MTGLNARRGHAAVIAMACGVALFACAPVAPEVLTTAQPAAANAGPIGNAASVGLSPIVDGEAQASRLEGELGCSFTRGGELLLLAMGDVGSDKPASGVIKVGSSIEAVSAPRGFNGMLRGATFTGRNKTIRIDLTSAKPLGDGESPPFPAKLTLVRPDGADSSIAGLWTCGP